jgi:hypothetical protein
LGSGTTKDCSDSGVAEGTTCWSSGAPCSGTFDNMTGGVGSVVLEDTGASKSCAASVTGRIGTGTIGATSADERASEDVGSVEVSAGATSFVDVSAGSSDSWKYQ